MALISTLPVVLTAASKSSGTDAVNVYASIAGGVTGLVLLGLFTLAKKRGLLDRLKERWQARRGEAE